MGKPKRIRSKLDLPGSKKHLEALLLYTAERQGKTRSELVVELIEDYLKREQLLDVNGAPAVQIVDGKVVLDPPKGMKPLFAAPERVTHDT